MIWEERKFISKSDSFKLRRGEREKVRGSFFLTKKQSPKQKKRYPPSSFFSAHFGCFLDGVPQLAGHPRFKVVHLISTEKLFLQFVL